MPVETFGGSDGPAGTLTVQAVSQTLTQGNTLVPKARLSHSGRSFLWLAKQLEKRRDAIADQLAPAALQQIEFMILDLKALHLNRRGPREAGLAIRRIMSGDMARSAPARLTPR